MIYIEGLTKHIFNQKKTQNGYQTIIARQGRMGRKTPNNQQTTMLHSALIYVIMFGPVPTSAWSYTCLSWRPEENRV